MAVSRPRYKAKKQRRGGKFQRGFYRPINEDKYRQPQDRTMNSGMYPEYRSSWELAFYRWCDNSDTIEFWGTESFAIRYLSPKDNAFHRYYVDIVLMMKTGQKHLIEIKPKAQCNDPVNLAKWAAARDYCAQIGAIFSVVTEVELKKWGLIKK